MPTKEEVLGDIIECNKKNIIKIMTSQNCPYNEALTIWLKINKSRIDNIMILRADNDGVKLL